MRTLADYPRARKLTYQPFDKNSAALVENLPEIANESASDRQRRQRAADIKGVTELFSLLGDDVNEDQVLVICFADSKVKLIRNGEALYESIKDARGAALTFYAVNKSDIK